MNCNILRIFLGGFLLAFIFNSQLCGQNQTISGTVTDAQSGETLPGVNILLKGTTSGTSTDSKGNFTLEVSSLQDTLVFSYIGYQTRKIPIEGRTTVNVMLNSQAITGKELVVVGYGTQQRQDLTGSVASVNKEAIDNISTTPISSPEQAIQGRVAGVQVTQSSGAPGGGISVRVRGSTSLTAGSEPLYVIDGFPVNSNNDTFSAGNFGFGGQSPSPQNALASLNPNNIASIEVLKDASATAIYGSRGANGVVLITTKRGKEGKTSINFSSYYGFKNLAKKLDLLSAKQYAEIANIARVNSGFDPLFSQSDISSLGVGTDWQDELFETAPMQNYQLSVSGGNEDTKFTISGNYMNEDGIIQNSGIKKASVRINLDKEIDDQLSFGNSLSLSRVINNQALTGRINNSTISKALKLTPVLPLRQSNGAYTVSGGLPSGQTTNIGNPVAEAVNFLNKTVSSRIIGNIFGKYDISDHLSYKLSLGIDFLNAKRDSYSPSFLQRSIAEGRKGIAEVESRNIYSPLIENLLTYSKSFNQDHDIKITGLYSLQSQKVEQENALAFNFPTDAFKSYNLSAASSSRLPVTNVTNWTLNSILARINYSFKDRYLITTSLRGDGSSKFGSGNKWGYFPSFALGWRLSEEGFLNDIDVINNLKLRGSYGITGNQEIGTYQSLASLSSLPVPFGENVGIGFFPSQIANPDLKWEKTTQFDVGLDGSLFSEKLSFGVDYYKKNTEDLLLYIQLPLESGIKQTLQNAGGVENKGIDVSLKYQTSQSKNYRWDISGNISFLQNKVTSLGPGEISRIGTAANPDGRGLETQPFNILKVGEPIGSFFGYETQAIWQEGEDFHTGYEAGNIHYVDQNGDGAITGEDRVIIGSPIPNFFYGLSSSIHIKNFGLSVFLRGSYGNDVFNANKFTLLEVGTSNNSLKKVLDSWTPENPSNTYPKIGGTGAGPQGQLISDRFVENGSYLRLQNLRFTYNFSSISLAGINIQKGKIYVSGQNLLTVTNYSGYDPEVNAFGQSNTNLGVDFGSYPRSRTYTIGLSLGF